MRILFSLFSFLLLSYLAKGQKDIAAIEDSITAEGKLLYQSEMASWYGTDLFMEKSKEKEKAGGYFSYSDNGIAKCIFYSKEANPKVIGTISFDSSYSVSNAITDLTEREFSGNENKLYKIRTSALKIINGDTLFKTYKNTSLNLIPIISNNESKVYVLTGPKNNGVVIFGNDYLITFDKNDEIKLKKHLHQNIIVIEYGDSAVSAMHSHLPETGDFITATDICTLMLYEKFAKWKQHTVVSKNYVSIWDCEKNIFVAITKEVMDKINADQKKRQRKD